ncbi:hypothetical protein [Geomonas oryzae]|uniref:hypothetical protein n=1 Tax=Geomonas oryzae TaxID=2364273 RepID=UPI00100AC2E1|nr:hypothetical protein [Geomonas oryzae]
MPLKRKALFALMQVVALPLMVPEIHASNVGVDVNIHLGNQPRPVVVAPPPPAPRPVVVAPAPPAPYYDDVEEDVEFVYPERLGFYVAVGVPYDLFYLNNVYFVFRDGRWYRSPDNRGGWYPVRYRELPPSLRRYRIERIREYRAREYDVYRHDREHYRGRHRSDKGYWKAVRHEAKEQRKEDKRFNKEQRKEEKRFEKEQRKEDKRFEKEQRREEREFDRDHHGR